MVTRIEDREQPEDEQTLEAFLRCAAVGEVTKADTVLACMELLGVGAILAEGITNSVITRLSATGELVPVRVLSATGSYLAYTWRASSPMSKA